MGRKSSGHSAGVVAAEPKGVRRPPCRDRRKICGVPGAVHSWGKLLDEAIQNVRPVARTGLQSSMCALVTHEVPPYWARSATYAARFVHISWS